MNALHKNFGKAALIAALISLIAFTVVLAASGDLDPAFGSGGKLTTDVTPDMRDKAYSVAVQSDGRILVVGESYNLDTATGDVALVRYNGDGTLDDTFNGTGIVVTDLGGVDQGRDLVIQPDGRIVVSGRMCNAGYTDCDLAVIRYNDDGSLDTGFNSDGIAIVPYKTGNNGTYGGLELAADGKILVAGYAIESPTAPYDFAIYRLTANGDLDPTFSNDGVKMINFGASHSDVAQDIAIQPDGKIIAVGYTCENNGTHCDFALARLKPGTGALDKTFNYDGKQTTNFGGEEQAPSVALQSDGKIVLAGRKVNGSTINMAVARYTSNGTLDKTFNGSGKKVINFLSGYEEANYDVLVQPDGKIVTLGYVTNQGNNFAVVRLNPSGSYDTSFGVSGKVEIDFGFDDFAYALTLDLDGNYVLAGRVDDGATQYFALARILP
jgi:uncharacterized delta-60 repeat protein